MKRWPWFVLSVLVIGCDQLTKQLVTQSLLAYEPYRLTSMINLTLAYNTGAAFSFLSGRGDWHQLLLTGFSTIMSVALVVWIARTKQTTYQYMCALSLILGGAVGNLIDRLNYGHVIDFIDVHYKTHHWYVFNLADSAICLGAALLMLMPTIINTPKRLT